MLFPAWMAGRPIAASCDRFQADRAYAFMARHKVMHTFLAPTAVKRLAETPDPRALHDLALRVICTGGEALADETLTWAENKLGVIYNEFYSMTEVNHLIGNCAALCRRRTRSMGRAYPGHQVTLVDVDDKPVEDGEPGEVVTESVPPTRFLGYLNSPEKEAEMSLGPWLRTHDLAVRDADGYFWYKGRSHDLIKSSGFRIGPTEIEKLRHLLDDPLALGIGPGDAFAGVWIFDIAKAVPDQAADIEFVIQDAGAAATIAVNCARTPTSTGSARNAFGVELVGDTSAGMAEGVVFENSARDCSFGLVDSSVAADWLAILVNPLNDVIAIAKPAARLSGFDPTTKTTAGLVGEIL